MLCSMRDIFVPSGTLPPDYLSFQLLDCVQAASSYLRGVLTLHATLRGAGLGADDAAAAAAVYAFILKEGSSHIGSLVFAWRLGQKFDGEVRFYRLAADLANDVGLTLELIAPLAGATWFLPLTCTANVAKALCGVAAGATRVAISAHFASSTSGGASVGEMAAKEGAQETAVTLLGLLLGLRLASVLNTSVAVQLIAFAVLTLIHIAANYAAVRVLQLRTLSRSRLLLLVDHYRAWRARTQSSGPWHPPSPAELALVDPVVPLQYGSVMDAVFAGAYSWLVDCGTSASSVCSGRRSSARTLRGRCTEGMRLHLGCKARDIRRAAQQHDSCGVYYVRSSGVGQSHAEVATCSDDLSPHVAAGLAYVVISGSEFDALPNAVHDVRAADAFLITAVPCSRLSSTELTIYIAFFEHASATTRALAVSCAEALAHAYAHHRSHAQTNRGWPRLAAEAVADASADWPIAWGAIAAAGYSGVVVEEERGRVSL